MVAIETPDTVKPQSRARSLRKAASRASGKSGFFSGKSKSVERADLEEAAEPTAAEPPVETPADAAAEGADETPPADAATPDGDATPADASATTAEPTLAAPGDVNADEASALALNSSLEKYLEAREATATENAAAGVVATATAVDAEAVKLAGEAPPPALRAPAPRAREGGCCFLGFGAN